MKEIDIEAKIENLNEVFAFVDGQLEAIGCPMKVMMQIDVAVDELFSNIAMYAYAPGTGRAKITLDAEDDPRRVILTLSDSGMPYNPLEKEDPDITLSAEERKIGGLGIYMTKKIMDHMEYKYENGHNIIVIVKEF